MSEAKEEVSFYKHFKKEGPQKSVYFIFNSQAPGIEQTVQLDFLTLIVRNTKVIWLSNKKYSLAPICVLKSF